MFKKKIKYTIKIGQRNQTFDIVQKTSVLAIRLGPHQHMYSKFMKEILFLPKKENMSFSKKKNMFL